MTDDDIKALYRTLDRMVVPIAHDPTYGPVYLQEKLIEARGKQAEVAEVVVAVNRAISEVLPSRIAQEAVVRISPSSSKAGEREKLDVIRTEHERLKFLLESAHVRRRELARVSSDVRLLLECLKVGMQAPGYRPPPVTEAETIRATTDPDVDQAQAGVRAFYAREPVEREAADERLEDILE